MEDTKRCPYCGEEIKAAAKKCIHCGEWLVIDETSKPQVSGNAFVNSTGVAGDLPQIDNMKTFLSSWIWPVVILALLAEIVVTVHEYCDLGGEIGRSGTVNHIMEAAQYVPEWLGYLCSGIAWGLFNAALMVGLKKYPSVYSLAKVNFILGIFVALAHLCVDEDSDAVILVLLVAIAYLVVAIILGRKLVTKFAGKIKDVGKWMIVNLVAEVAVPLIVACLPWDYQVMALILYLIYIWIVYQYLNKLYELLG